MTQSLQYTPSVYFNFDDTTNKTNFSKSNLFQLSCTNQKKYIINNIQLPTRLITQQDIININHQRKLKTDQFFQEFDNNFIVTFDFQQNLNGNQQINTNSLINNYSNTHISSESFNNNWMLIAQADNSRENFSNIQNIQLVKNLSQNQLLKDKIIDTSSEISKQVMPAKEKNSPIPYFEIKKRTVFKNKQNIINNQQFKITKKKILNKNTLQVFFDQSKSCIPQKSKKQIHNNEIKCLTSKIQTNNRFTVQNSLKNNFIVDNKYQSDNIFIQHKQFRESFRSITLNNWKRKLQKKRISNDKTTKRQNIFKNQHIAFVR